VDVTLQPFRAFVPAGLDRLRKYPLIIVLHGSVADENAYMDGYLSPDTRHNLLKELAKKHGYILATPKGRGPWDFYQWNAERDVLDVTDRMLRIYPIDSSRVPLPSIRFARSSPRPFLKSAWVRDENILDVVGMVGDIEMLSTDIEVRNVAEVARDDHEKRERVAPEREEVKAGNHTFLAGRKCLDHDDYGSIRVFNKLEAT
jgi:hypothetical protein